MVRKVGHVLHDILQAIDRGEQIARGKSFDDFERSWEMRWLVQRANFGGEPRYSRRVEKQAAVDPLVQSARHRQCLASRL